MRPQCHMGSFCENASSIDPKIAQIGFRHKWSSLLEMNNDDIDGQANPKASYNDGRY